MYRCNKLTDKHVILCRQNSQVPTQTLKEIGVLERVNATNKKSTKHVACSHNTKMSRCFVG